MFVAGMCRFSLGSGVLSWWVCVFGLTRICLKSFSKVILPTAEFPFPCIFTNTLYCHNFPFLSNKLNFLFWDWISLFTGEALMYIGYSGLFYKLMIYSLYSYLSCALCPFEKIDLRISLCISNISPSLWLAFYFIFSKFFSILTFPFDFHVL